MNVEMLRFILCALLMLLGLIFEISAVVGVFRFRYVLNRMHAAAMGDTMGVFLMLLGLAVGIIVSALTTRYRDLAMLVSFGVQLWMYATPVTYSSSMIAEKFPNLLGVYMLNPITPIIELFRAAYLGAAEYSLKYNAVSMAMTLVVLLIGVVLFSHTEKTFMDTI